MTVKTPVQHIEIAPGIAGGQPHVAGHRIKVRDIAIGHEHLGRSADEISAEHDLDLAEVYAALAYYFDHRAEIDHAIADSRDYVDGLRRQLPSVLEKRLNAAPHE